MTNAMSHIEAMHHLTRDEYTLYFIEPEQTDIAEPVI